jgi:hypothetical protein
MRRRSALHAATGDYSGMRWPWPSARRRADKQSGPQGFAASHCRNCAAGWTRTGKDDAVLTVCLLDREPVLMDMTGCDRYELKE